MAAMQHPLALTLGLLSHLLYFNRGEHHLLAVTYMGVFAATFVLSASALVSGGQSLAVALRHVTAVVGSYLTGLYCSLMFYRLCLHPLNNFPGPFGARLSNFWLSTKLTKGDCYRKFQQLHSRHGEFVRIGSSDLSIAHPEAVQAIYGRDSQCKKGEWYDMTVPMRSIQSVRVKALHDRRRRIWSPAFSDKALKGYEIRIQRLRNKLISQIDTFNGRSINICRWYHLYNFDVMGDLAFGTSFNMLENSEEHWAIKLLNEAIQPLGWMFPAWFFRLTTKIPALTKSWWSFIDYCTERLEDRRKSKPDVPDIMASLLDVYQGKEPIGEELNLLRGDAQVIVVAGSDTTAATLTNVTFLLCKNPQHLQKLRDELSPYMQDPLAEVLHQNIASLEHLNGVIWETLRLFPPVPSALPRKTPSEGITIGGVFVPGDMTVYCPQYVLGRREDIYSNAEAFIPERWYMYPDMVKDKSAWAPFSVGPYGCIGRPLALLNLRTTLARLVMMYDISFSQDPDDMGRLRSYEMNIKERLTLVPPDLNVCFKRRC